MEARTAGIEAGAAGIEAAAVESFAERVMGDMAGAYTFFMAGIGDRLGLFKELAQKGAATSSEFAERTGLDERYLREWLRGMTAAGYLDFEATTGRFVVPTSHVPVLAEEAGPAFFGAAFFNFSTNFGDSYRRLIEAFRTGGGVPQVEYGESAEAIERFTAPWFENQLVPVWLPAMPEVERRLRDGGSVCDVGCGRGRALIKLAQSFPTGRYTGVDLYEPAISEARANAEAAGVGDRIRFDLADASGGLPGRFDIVTTFDVLHDSGDPSGILREIHDALHPDGRYICVEINSADRPEDNIGPVAAILYGLSMEYCLTVSLASGGAGLGTLGLPQAKLTELARAAGFANVRRLPTDDPFNSVYEITK